MRQPSQGIIESELTLDGRSMAKRFFCENPKRSLSISGLTFSGVLSVIPRTSTGSVGGIERSIPRKVVITASLSVWYQVSTPGK